MHVAAPQHGSVAVMIALFHGYAADHCCICAGQAQQCDWIDLGYGCLVMQVCDG